MNFKGIPTASQASKWQPRSSNSKARTRPWSWTSKRSRSSRPTSQDLSLLVTVSHDVVAGEADGQGNPHRTDHKGGLRE